MSVHKILHILKTKTAKLKKKHHKFPLQLFKKKQSDNRNLMGGLKKQKMNFFLKPRCATIKLSLNSLKFGTSSYVIINACKKHSNKNLKVAFSGSLTCFFGVAFRKSNSVKIKLSLSHLKFYT